eukprot:958544-Prorocentrum_lima.AAC.1
MERGQVLPNIGDFTKGKHKSAKTKKGKPRAKATRAVAQLGNPKANTPEGDKNKSSGNASASSPPGG